MNIIGIASLVWSFGFAALTTLQLPERVAVHFDINGNPDRYGSRLEAGWLLFLLPVVMLIVQVILWWLAKSETRANQKKMLDIARVGSSLLLVLVQFLIVQSMQQNEFEGKKLLLLGIGVLLFAVGNQMPKIAPNAYVGVRIPWTFASDLAWYATNRLGGWVIASIGAVLVLCSLVLPSQWSIWAIVGMVIALFSSLSYLWFYARSIYQTDPDRRAL